VEAKSSLLSKNIESPKEKEEHSQKTKNKRKYIKDNERKHNYAYQYKNTHEKNKNRNNHQGNRDTFNPKWLNINYFRDPDDWFYKFKGQHVSKN
jgi:hypothetical protein